jgi:Ca2+/Na+ antiporter
MYKIEIQGCLSTLLIFLLILFVVKELWWLIVGLILICIAIYYGNLIYQTVKNKQKENEINYNPQMGEVFKVCPYCNTKVKVTEKTCPCCNRALN